MRRPIGVLAVAVLGAAAIGARRVDAQSVGSAGPSPQMVQLAMAQCNLVMLTMAPGVSPLHIWLGHACNAWMRALQAAPPGPGTVGAVSPSAPPAASTPAAAPLGLCEWRLTAGPPVSVAVRGTSATFIGMLGTPATMIMLGPGPHQTGVGSVNITASGISQAGSYPVGTATGNPPSGAVFTGTDAAGRQVGIATGDGRNNAPPPSVLTVASVTTGEIAGRVTGVFFLADGRDPPTTTDVLIEFRAASAMTGGCP